MKPHSTDASTTESKSPVDRGRKQWLGRAGALLGLMVLAAPVALPAAFAQDGAIGEVVQAEADADSGATTGSPKKRSGKGPLVGVVNINTATVDQLGLLPGIGPSRAQAIIELRKKHPFKTVDEIVRVKGIGRKMLKKMRTNLATSGPTTVGNS